MGAEYSIIAYVQWRRQGFRHYGHEGFAAASKRWAQASFQGRDGRPHPNEIRESLEGRNVIVTGANAGLGFHVARGLAARKATVHMVCRNESRGAAARDRIVEETGHSGVVLHVCDVSNQQSVREFAEAFQEQHRELYALVNNAGVMPKERQESADGVELSLATMGGGTFLLTGLLLEALQRSDSARVINVSSAGMYNMIVNPKDLNSEKRKYDGAQVYGIAKRVQCDLTTTWANAILGPDSKVSVVSMHPGWAETAGLKAQYPSFYEKAKDMLRSPDQGADTIIWLTCCSHQPHSGAFYFDREEHPTAFRYTRTESNATTRVATWNWFCRVFGWGNAIGKASST